MNTIRYIGAIAIAMMTAWSVTTASAQSAADDYQAAYELVLDENWNDAANALRSFTRNHADSKWVDDAQYWQCHVSEKKGDNLERVFECYEEFVDDYGSSSWANDAESSMIRVGQRLVSSGKREYEAIIKSLGNSSEEEVRLAALDALWQSGDERALDAILGLYDEGGSKKYRKKLIFGLSQFDSPRAASKLREIALNDENPEIRKDAIFWIVDNGGKDALDLLATLSDPSQPIEVQKQVVFAYSQLDEDGVDPLIKLARTSPHEDIRKDAVFWLGQIGGSEVVAFYDDLLQNSTDPEVQKQVLFGLHEIGGDESLRKLADVAKSNKNVDLRKDAIFWISQTDHQSAPGLIESIAASNPSPEIMKQVVFAYSQMGPDGLRRLNELARSHPDLTVRKESIFWVGQEGGSQATALFDDLLSSSTDEEILGQVVFALGQLDDDAGVDKLIDLAKNSQNAKVRKDAIFWLGQSDSEKARTALLQIVRGN